MNRQEEFNEAILKLSLYYKKDPQALVDHLRELGYSDNRIAKIVGLKRPTFIKKYPYAKSN